MSFLGESQQHTLTDIHGMLVELRQLVREHGEFLATFGQRIRFKEVMDSLDERSLPRRWSPPPSVTQEPMGFKYYSLPRLEPPRFEGKQALDWIRKVQEYYNYYYTPLDDRLYLTKYLFDPPATDWFHNYQNTNTDGSWEDFLVAVYYHFSPDLTERTDAPAEVIEKKEEKVEEMPAQVVEEAAHVVNEVPPTESEADIVEENQIESQGDIKIEEKAVEAENIEPKSVVAGEVVETAKPQTEAIKRTSGDEVMPKDIKSEEPKEEVEKVFECLTQASDGRAIPPRIDVTLLGFSNDELIFACSCILDYSYMLNDVARYRIHIFDPGIFDVSKLICYGTLEDLTATLSIGVNNEGSYFFYPP